MASEKRIGVFFCWFIIIFVSVCALYDFSDWFTATKISAISTVVIAIFTIFLGIETRYLRKIQAEHIQKSLRPVINFDLSRNDNHINSNQEYLVLNVSNTGAQPAHNVQFHFISLHLDERESGVLEHLPLTKNGIKVIGAGKNRSQFVSTLKEIDVSYRGMVYVTYNDGSGREKYKDLFDIDFFEFVTCYPLI